MDSSRAAHLVVLSTGLAVGAWNAFGQGLLPAWQGAVLVAMFGAAMLAHGVVRKIIGVLAVAAATSAYVLAIDDPAVRANVSMWQFTAIFCFGFGGMAAFMTEKGARR